MKTKIALLALALGASTYLASAQDNPTTADSQAQPAQSEHGPGGMNGQHRPGGRGGFHLLPPRAEQMLQLTDDQKKQVAELEVETKAKLGKILTAEQMKKLNHLRPPMRPGGPGGRDRGFGGNQAGGENNGPSGSPPADGNDMNPPAGPPPADN